MKKITKKFHLWSLFILFLSSPLVAMQDNQEGSGKKKDSESVVVRNHDEGTITRVIKFDGGNSGIAVTANPDGSNPQMETFYKDDSPENKISRSEFDARVQKVAERFEIEEASQPERPGFIKVEDFGLPEPKGKEHRQASPNISHPTAVPHLKFEKQDEQRTNVPPMGKSFAEAQGHAKMPHQNDPFLRRCEQIPRFCQKEGISFDTPEEAVNCGNRWDSDKGLNKRACKALDKNGARFLGKEIKRIAQAANECIKRREEQKIRGETDKGVDCDKDPSARSRDGGGKTSDPGLPEVSHEKGRCGDGKAKDRIRDFTERYGPNEGGGSGRVLPYDGGSGNKSLIDTFGDLGKNNPDLLWQIAFATGIPQLAAKGAWEVTKGVWAGTKFVAKGTFNGVGAVSGIIEPEDWGYNYNPPDLRRSSLMRIRELEPSPQMTFYPEVMQSKPISVDSLEGFGEDYDGDFDIGDSGDEGDSDDPDDYDDFSRSEYSEGGLHKGEWDSADDSPLMDAIPSKEEVAEQIKKTSKEVEFVHTCVGSEIKTFGDIEAEAQRYSGFGRQIAINALGIAEHLNEIGNPEAASDMANFASGMADVVKKTACVMRWAGEAGAEGISNFSDGAKKMADGIVYDPISVAQDAAQSLTRTTAFLAKALMLSLFDKKKFNEKAFLVLQGMSARFNELSTEEKVKAPIRFATESLLSIFTYGKATELFNIKIAPLLSDFAFIASQELKVAAALQEKFGRFAATNPLFQQHIITPCYYAFQEATAVVKMTVEGGRNFIQDVNIALKLLSEDPRLLRLSKNKSLSGYAKFAAENKDWNLKGLMHILKGNISPTKKRLYSGMHTMEAFKNLLKVSGMKAEEFVIKKLPNGVRQITCPVRAFVKKDFWKKAMANDEFGNLIYGAKTIWPDHYTQEKILKATHEILSNVKNCVREKYFLGITSDKIRVKVRLDDFGKIVSSFPDWIQL